MGDFPHKSYWEFSSVKGQLEVRLLVVLFKQIPQVYQYQVRGYHSEPLLVI